MARHPVFSARIARPAVVGLLAGWVAAGCSSLPPPGRFPDLGEMDDATAVAVLEARTRSVRSLYAELTIVFEGPELDGVFDAVVHFRDPGSIRMTAFKDLVFSFESIFDLILTPSAFALSMVEEQGAPPVVKRGTSGFPEDHPRFSGFFWAREAFCLPGVTTGAPTELTRDGGFVRVSGQLSSGAKVTWRARERTLEIEEGFVRTPRGRELFLEFSDYRVLDGVFVPGRVTFRSPAEETTISCRLRDLEVNPVLGDDLFDCDAF